MKKEKTVKTYQRRTKTGKVVTVKQHTAKYDAAEALKEAAKKKGAGDELEALKNKKPEKVKETLSDEELREIDYPQKDIDAVAKALGLTQREAASWMAGTDFSGYRKADMKKGDKAAKKYLGNDVFSKLDPTDADVPLAVLAKLGRKLGGSKFMRVRDLVNASKGAKVEKAPKETKSSDSGIGFTAEEYKAWYHWDTDADPKNAAAKKVEKALKAKMGAKGYKKYFDEMTDSYSSRGHNKAYKALDAEATVPKKDAKTPKSSDSSLKVGSSIQMGNSTSLGKGKKETFKVLAVQKTNKQDRELGNTEAAWVQRKDGSVTLALKDSEKGWMYDDTWTDFTDRKHPYAKSLEAAGYSFKKAQGKGGKYWEVSKSKSHYDPYKDLKEAYKDYKDSIKADSSAEGKKRAAQNLLGEMGVSMQGANAKTKNLLMQIHKETGLDISKHKFYGKLPEVKAYSSKETKADSSEYGKAPKHLGMTQQEWNDWMDGGAGYKAADKKAKAHLEKLYGKEGAKAIRKKYEGDGSNKYIDLVSKATADKKILSEIGGASKSSKEDDWKSAPKESGKYRAGKQKEGAEKEGLIYPKVSKSKTPRRGSKAAYEAAQKAKASLTSYVDASPYKRVLKSMNTYGGQVNKNELIGKLVKKGLSHAEASKIAGQFATKVKTEFTKSRQYRPGAK